MSHLFYVFYKLNAEVLGLGTTGSVVHMSIFTTANRNNSNSFMQICKQVILIIVY